MFSAIEMTIKAYRLCGHSEMQDIRYKGTRQRQEIERYERMRWCKGCEQAIRDWFSDSSIEGYPLALPSLIGSDKQVPWAKKIRDGRAFQLLKVMSHAAESDSKMGIALWHAIYAYLGQTHAKTWIDSRDEIYGPDFFALEASYYLMPSTLGLQFSPRSIYGRLKEKAPYRLQEIKALVPQKRSLVPSELQTTG